MPCAPEAPTARGGITAAVACALVRDELMLDANSRQNLATFWTTWMEPEVRQLMALERQASNAR